MDCISEEITGHIIENIKPMVSEENNKTWWRGRIEEGFTVKSAFNIMRRKKEENEWLSNILIKKIPFKIFFSYGELEKGELLLMIT